MKLRNLILYFSLIIVVSCNDEPKGENYQLKSSDDLILTADNHPHGFTYQNCFYCHVKANIHQEDRLGTNLLELARELTAVQGLGSCQMCHGGNGVSP